MVAAKSVVAVVLAVIEQPLLNLQLQQTTQLQLAQVALSDQRSLLVEMAVPAPVPYSQQLLQLVVVTVAVLVQVKLAQTAVLAVQAVGVEVITPLIQGVVALEIRQAQAHHKEIMAEPLQAFTFKPAVEVVLAQLVQRDPQVVHTGLVVLVWHQALLVLLFITQVVAAVARRTVLVAVHWAATVVAAAAVQITQ